MSHMLDLIKRNAVPAAVVRSASKGALSIPAAEMIEILVYLTNNPVFSQDAKMTLAGWNEESARSVVSSEAVQREVLEYFWAAENRRPRLMPALIENPQIPEQHLVELASTASREIVDMMLASNRVRGSQQTMQALSGNPHLTPDEAQQIRAESGNAKSEPADQDTLAAHQTFQQMHAAEMAAEAGTPFELTEGPDEPEPSAPAAPAEAPVAVASAPPKAPPTRLTVDARKRSTIQKLMVMSVAERVKTAFLGSKEERSILIRDGSKIVQNAVLASPKLSEPEVEFFAGAKNVQENVLREISRNRRFMKSYVVIRALVNNPRCPLDVSLTLIKNLLLSDLKSLQSNKNVPDTVRRVAYKMYKEKSTPPGQKPE
jgi:hypothetical protein